MISALDRDSGVNHSLYTIIVSEYLAVNETLLTVKYSLYTLRVSEYLAVNKIVLTAKYSLYTTIVSKNFAVTRIINCEMLPLFYNNEYLAVNKTLQLRNIPSLLLLLLLRVSNSPLTKIY